MSKLKLDKPSATVFDKTFNTGDRFKAVQKIENGLKVIAVDQIARDLQLPAAAIRKLAKISSSTFNRRQEKGLLSPEESDRVYRLRSIGDAWWTAASSLILNVPSAALHTDDNYLIDPSHPNAGRPDMGSAEPLMIDDRIKKLFVLK